MLFIILGFILAGCSQPGIKDLDPTKQYKIDLNVEINEKHGQGFMVIPKAQNYDITVHAIDEVDLVTLNTCHREMSLQKQNNQFKISITPNEIESSGYCPLIIQTFISKQRYNGAFIDIIDTTLKAHLVCNGESKDFIGASVCQSPAEMIQQISFESPVKQGTPDPECAKVVQKKDNKYEIKLNKGFCVYVFRDANKKIHRLTTYGYE